MILAAAVLAGSLCLEAAPCVATSSARAAVAVAPEERRWVWISDDRTVVVLGTLAPNAAEVALDAGTSRSLRIQVRERTAVAFELGPWRWTIRNPPPAIRLVHPPCGDCVLEATAEGYRPFEKKLRETTDVALHPWPKLRGRVVDATSGTPLAGATISIGGKLVAKSDAAGTFEARVEQEWPRAIEVAWPGRATRRVQLPRVEADADLADIILATGGTLRVHIDPPIQQKLTWELREPLSRELLRQGSIEPGAVDSDISGIAEGKHGFAIRGERPLQQFGTDVVIANESVTETKIAIEPMRLTLEVTRRAEPLAGAKVHIRVWKSIWLGEVTLDGEGRATEEIWQRGVVNAYVASGGKRGYSTDKRIESDETTWRIAIPDRRITGRLLDAASGEPLRDARLGIHVKIPATADLPNLASMWSEKTDDEGRFLFDNIDPGSHELETLVPAYQQERVQVEVGEGAGAYERDILLRRPGGGRTLILTDERGFPVPDAAVFLGDAAGLREVAATGLDGRCDVPLGADAAGVIFVVPRSGSFAFLRVRPQRGDDATIPMRVRSGSALLEIATRDGEGEPVPNVHIAMRVDGMMLPPPVVDALLNRQGLWFRTDATGRARLGGMPQGVYELWAVTGRDQMTAVRSGTPPPPAASLEVERGHYTVTIELAAR